MTTKWSNLDQIDDKAEGEWHEDVGSYAKFRFHNTSKSAWEIIGSIVKTIPQGGGHLRINPRIKLKDTTGDDRIILYVFFFGIF